MIMVACLLKMDIFSEGVWIVYILYYSTLSRIGKSSDEIPLILRGDFCLDWVKMLHEVG